MHEENKKSKRLTFTVMYSDYFLLLLVCLSNNTGYHCHHIPSSFVSANPLTFFCLR